MSLKSLGAVGGGGGGVSKTIQWFIKDLEDTTYLAPSSQLFPNLAHSWLCSSSPFLIPVILTCFQVFRTLPPPLHLLHLILPSWFLPSPHLLFANLHTLQPQNLLQCNGCIGLLCHRLGKTMLHSTALPRTTLHCTALHCTALHCTALNCSALHKTELHCTEHHCTGLNCTALHCTKSNTVYTPCICHPVSTHCLQKFPYLLNFTSYKDLYAPTITAL